jgi:hypothetical protein
MIMGSAIRSPILRVLLFLVVCLLVLAPPAYG